MSCDRNNSRFINLCAARSGVSRAGNRAAGVLGATATAAREQVVRPVRAAGSGLNAAKTGTQRQVGRASGAALTVLNSIEGPGSVDKLASLAVVGAIASDALQSRRLPVASTDDEAAPRPTSRPRVPNWRNRTLNVVGGLTLGRAVAGSAGLSLARLSKPEGAAVRQRNYFGGRVVVRSWESRLTRYLNAADVPPGLTVLSSAGRMMEHRNKAWHVGSTVVRSSAGERAITHLQSMTAPAQHYYFNRALSDQETAGIIAGHDAFNPKTLPGYAGEIGEVEALLPGAARLKRGLIRNHLFWGDQS
ncbi:MAG: hypothetical protein Kow0031_19270 [Anaerolineae bacterium]